MNVPKLRFKEFSGGWDSSKKLQSYIVSLQSGKSKIRLDQGRFPFYGSTGVIGFTDSPDYEGKTLLIARVGANAGDLFSVKGNYSVSDNTLMVKVSEKNDFNFFKYLLEGFNINRLVFGSGQPLVTGGQLKELLIVVPVLPEQTKIASFLTTIDEKIAQLTQKHELLSQYKKGVMQQIFSQQLRFKDDNSEEFGAWEEIEIGEVVAYEQPQKYLVSSTEYNDLFRTPVLTAGKTFILGYTDETAGIYDATKNNVIIFDDFTTAYKFVNFSFKAKSSAMKILKPIDKEKTNIKFIFEAMSEINFSLGDEHKRRWISEYSKEIIPYPSFPEQTKIANFLSSIDQKIDQAAAQLDAVKQYKRGLLQQMFV